MPRYEIEVSCHDEIEGKDENDAMNKFMADIEGQMPFHIWIWEHLHLTEVKGGGEK